MELVSVVILAAILFGPIIWALTGGRNARAPAEDAKGSTGFGYLIRKILTAGRR